VTIEVIDCIVRATTYADRRGNAPFLLTSLYIVTIVTSVKIAVTALTADARKKYQHHEKAQPGAVSIEDIIYTRDNEK
jgi:hypothetical protein